MRKLFAGVVCSVLLCVATAVAATGLTMDIQRVGIDLKITAVDDGGKPCGACDVTIKDGDGTPLVVGRTDDAGTFEFDISGLELIKITVSGHAGEVVEKEVDNALGSDRKKYKMHEDAEVDGTHGTAPGNAVATDDVKTKELADGGVVEGPPTHNIIILLIFVGLVFVVIKLFKFVSKGKNSSL